MTSYKYIDPAVEDLRPLRYPLRSGDKIFFLHIPKTAGTTLTSILQRQFQPGEYISLPNILDMTPEILQAMQEARLVRAHRSYDFQKAFTRRPYVVTILRHPFDRLISNYAHLLRHDVKRLEASAMRANPERDPEEPVSLEEYLRIPAMQNRQMQFLIGPASKASRKVGLSLAKAHLESIAFFGLKERFDESIRLLAYTFGWPSITNYESQNQAPPTSKPQVTPEIQALLEETNHLDLLFYEFACELFDFRIEQLNRKGGK